MRQSRYHMFVSEAKELFHNAWALVRKTDGPHFKYKEVRYRKTFTMPTAPSGGLSVPIEFGAHMTHSWVSKSIDLKDVRQVLLTI